MSEENTKPKTKADLEAQNAELEAKLAALEAAQQAPQAALAEDDPKRPVLIQLFKDGGKYKDDLFVGINNKSWQIQRGVQVTVPYYVSQAIMESQTQDAATAKLIEMRELEFAPLAERGVL